MEHVEINYLAILVAGIIAMVIGSIWYGPILGKLWMREEGYSEEYLKKGFNPLKTYGLAFLGHIIIAYVLARVIGYVGAINIVEGLRVAFLCWLGFVGATKMINYLFERKSLILFLINSGYHLVVMLITSIILIIWI